MKLHIIIKQDADPQALRNDLTNAGYQIQVIELYPQWIFVMVEHVEDFKHADHPSIESCKPEPVYTPFLSHPVAIGGFVQGAGAAWSGGSWGILRHIVRDNPFFQSGTRRIVLPYSGTYNCERTGNGVDIYILDSGIWTNHEQFDNVASRVQHVYQVNNQTNGDSFGHGTACAGCAAGKTLGFAKNASLWGAQGLEMANGSGTLSNLASACNSILNHYNGRSGLNRPAILNGSFGLATTPSDEVSTRTTYEQMFNPLINAGIVVVVAAGNGRLNLEVSQVYPAEINNLICVGGSNAGDEAYCYDYHGTNYGPNAVDVVAAGENVYVPWSNGNTSYQMTHGTSFSSPHTVGVIACMLEGYNRLTSLTQVQAVRTYLMAEATTGRLRQNTYQPTIPDRLLYLNPAAASAISTIPGLTKKA